MNNVDIIKDLCKKRGISVSKLEKDLGIGNGAITKSSSNYMRSDRLKAIADYFNVPMEYLMTGQDPDPETGYYLDPESAELAEFAHKNPEYKVLFDASRNVKPEDINFVLEMIKRTANYDD